MKFLDLYEAKKESDVNIEYSYKNALKDIESKNLYSFVCNIHKTKHNTGASNTGFYVGSEFIEYNDPKFTELSRKLIDKYGDKLKDELKVATQKRYEKGVPNHKMAEADKIFIDTKLASYFENPRLAIKKAAERKDGEDTIGDESTYTKIGQALVYRTSEFVSKLADTTTKISESKFKQLMIDAFNSEEEENFLYGIVDIEAKMRIDAAKKTVHQEAKNNDALNKFGADKSEEISQNDDDESIADSYYASISNELKTTNLLYESEKVPRKVSQFSNNARIAAKQADAVEATWPRQFKSWYEKYKSAFDKGVKEAQDKVRKGGAGDEKYVEDPFTHKKINIRKGWGTGGPQAFLDDLYVKYPSTKAAADAIKSGNLTVFNMGPRLVLGLCSALSKGGKVLQQIKDDFAEGFKEIKSAFKSNGSTKDYEAQVQKAVDDGNYGEAVAAQSVVVTADCSQLLTLMENGPIGTVDFDNNTFSTANSNSQSSLEVAVQNLIGQLSKYSDVYDKYSENKDVKINKTATDTVVANDKEEKKEEPEEEDQEEQEESAKPKYRPFTQFLNEADEDDESSSDGETDDESDAGETQEDQLNASLEQMSAIKDIFEENVDIPRLKEIQKVLKSFIEDGNLENNKGGINSLKDIINLYDIMIKDDLKFDVNSESIKQFVDGLSALNEVKEIPVIENQVIHISEDIKTFPAMEHVGTFKKKISSEENAAKLAASIKATFTDAIMKEVEGLNNFARSCSDDSWFNEYNAKNEKLNELKNILTTELEKVYGAGKINDWYYDAVEELDSLNYLPKLYKLIAIGSCIASQLENQSGDEIEESVENIEIEPLKPKKKPGSVYRSLYENDEPNDQEPEQQDDNGENPFEVVKHNIPTLEERLSSVDFRNILPPDKNNKVYDVENVEQFNQYMRSFANNAKKGLDIVHGTNGNGIVPIARNIVSQDNDAGEMMRDHLNKSNCKKICVMFNEGTDKNRDHSDLYAYYATAWAILKHSKEVFNKQEQKADTKAREGLNRESNKIEDSYQFPGVSPDSLINEIYKYIRGSK